MTARRTLKLVVALALLSASGLIGMLLAQGAWDWGFFVLAVLPLAVGSHRAWAHRSRRSSVSIEG